MANKFSCHWGKNKMNHLGLHPLFRDIPITLVPFQDRGCCLSKRSNQHLVKSLTISLLMVGKAWKIWSWLGEMCSVVTGGFLLKFEKLKVHGEGQKNLSRGSEPITQGSSLLEHQSGLFSAAGLTGAQRVLEKVVQSFTVD